MNKKIFESGPKALNCAQKLESTKFKEFKLSKAKQADIKSDNSSQEKGGFKARPLNKNIFAGDLNSVTDKVQSY